MARALKDDSEQFAKDVYAYVEQLHEPTPATGGASSGMLGNLYSKYASELDVDKAVEILIKQRKAEQ